MTKDGGETLQGTLSQDQLSRIRKLAGSLRPETRDTELVYRGSELFVAQVVRDGKTLWVDPTAASLQKQVGQNGFAPTFGSGARR